MKVFLFSKLKYIIIKLYFYFFLIIEKLLSRIGIYFKKKILIDCRELFHYHHIKPVVDQLLLDNKVKVYLLQHKNFSKKNLSNGIATAKNFKSHRQLKLLKFDLTISLAYDDQYWIPHKGLHLFAQHGDGMKGNYTGCERLKKYNIIFSVGKESEKLQKKYIKKDAVIERIGFIINDSLVNSCYNKFEIAKELDIINGLPIVLYAPSWSDNPNLIMMTEDIIYNLVNQEKFNIIFKPHPYLLSPERCGGKDWSSILNKINKKGFNLITSSTNPIQHYMYISDLLVSDISSVIFEYLYLDRPIILQVNDDIINYYDGRNYFSNIEKLAFTFRDPLEIIDTMSYAITHPLKHSIERMKLLNNKYYNIGTAKNAAVQAIYKHLMIS